MTADQTYLRGLLIMSNSQQSGSEEARRHEIERERDVQKIADEAAKKAVRHTFRLFGVDTEDQKSVNEFRSDLTHARKMRRLWDGAGNRVSMGILIAVAIAGVVWAADGIKAFFGMKGM